MKVDKQRILEYLDARGEAERAEHVDANLPPAVNLELHHHRAALERLGVDVEELESVMSGRV